jgi:hypothetical protein
LSYLRAIAAPSEKSLKLHLNYEETKKPRQDKNHGDTEFTEGNQDTSDNANITRWVKLKRSLFVFEMPGSVPLWFISNYGI